jgi:hypothetical protein
VKGLLEKEVSQKVSQCHLIPKTPLKKKNLLDQMEAINPLNHYYNLFCFGRLSENISKVCIVVLLFLKIKLHNDRVVHICGIMPSKSGRKIMLKLKT